MKVIVFGATGMIGQGVLRECLLDPGIEKVLALGRSVTGQQHAKLVELVHKDFSDFSPIESELVGLKACFFCLGVSSAGMSEADYSRVTYDYALVAARTLLKQNPELTFIYISGAGTDSSEKGSSMWARVKGKTENALLKMPFQAAYMFRPGYIQPVHGVRSRTKLYRGGYAVMGPLYPLWKALFPKYVMTTEQLGQAMIKAAKDGAPKRVLEAADILALWRGKSAIATHD